MASYLSLTPKSAVELGGNFNGETGSQQNKCVTYSEVGGPWFFYHGVSYSNRTGFSGNTRVIAQADVSVTYPQSSVIELNDYETPACTFVRTTSTYLDSSQAALMSGQHFLSEGTARVYSKYVPSPNPVTYNGVKYQSGSTVTLGGQTYQVASNATYLYPDGIYPLQVNNIMYGSSTMFYLNNYIVIDFDGANCRNSYITFVLGGNELDALYFANGNGLPPSHEGRSIGWLVSVPYGVASPLSTTYKRIIYNTSDQPYYISIPTYSSVDFVYIGQCGLSVVFKNTTNTNGAGYEVFTLYSQDKSNAVVVIVQNFKMS